MLLPRFFFALIFSLLQLAAAAQQPITYTLSFPNAVHHEADIKVVFAELPAGLFSVRMARSSPGRYALHEFAKNIYKVKAYNSVGQEITLTRPNPHQWDIPSHDGTVTITYTLFGDRADGTYNGISEEHVHLNMPATLMYGLGLDNRARLVQFNLPAGKNWQIATQLKKETTPNTYTAPHLQYLMDSPVEISDLKFSEWQLPAQNKTIRIALHTQAGDKAFADYTTKAKKVVAEAGAVFGQFPDYDFNSYTFLACYGPQAVGDGMEHRNSTFITSSQPLENNVNTHLSTFSHEYFHSWNVERIRPKSLEPFNYAEANMSGELWFAEGFTNYYGDLVLCRSGVNTVTEYAQNISAELNHVLNSPGHQYFSPVQMSYQAPFVDAAQSIDPVNRVNTYISYYPFGSVIGLALDLTLRTRFKIITLDTYMQAIWRKHGQPEIPYTLTDLENILGSVTRDPEFAQAFFQQHIYGLKLADYKFLLAQAGFLLRPVNPNKASLGLTLLNFRNNAAVIQTGTLVGSPLYQAGLDREDVIQTIAGKKINSYNDLAAALAAHKPGDRVNITYTPRVGASKETIVTLIPDPQLEAVPYETAGLPLTKQMKAFRASWLSSKVKSGRK
ncbi:M61 family metallopeptidase [Adhaeribacter rhizoryzae]|uniref:M61 family metallopeptidase n=1 Tax=Adhaeribacter rhizoryzae TaxID=2607907 RepID=UPI001CC1CD42|nr:PDZ domain-containing protein [Adhaeribacter rhizoryzae]